MAARLGPASSRSCNRWGERNTMLTLDHNDMSVCSQKVRLCLAEKALAHEARHLNLRAGDQQKPEYLTLNPKGVVPVPGLLDVMPSPTTSPDQSRASGDGAVKLELLVKDRPRSRRSIGVHRAWRSHAETRVSIVRGPGRNQGVQMMPRLDSASPHPSSRCRAAVRSRP
jgi:Glutathione S-transferase, N-terminal domain